MTSGIFGFRFEFVDATDYAEQFRFEHWPFAVYLGHHFKGGPSHLASFMLILGSRHLLNPS
jgi:hypothetical protein